MKKEEKNPVYVLCPRCELNYISKKDKLCTVCKAEMGLADPSILIPDEEEIGVERLCPVCKINYIGDDEDICFLCLKEKDEKNNDKSDWDYGAVDEIADEEEHIEELGIVADGEEFFEEEEEEEFADRYKEPEDFDIDDSEFEDYDETEDDEESDDWEEV